MIWETFVADRSMKNGLLQEHVLKNNKKDLYSVVALKRNKPVTFIGMSKQFEEPFLLKIKDLSRNGLILRKILDTISSANVYFADLSSYIIVGINSSNEVDEMINKTKKEIERLLVA